ncbi:MAG: helix-turn-helix transcriptional regulator [Clostridiales bacterium]|nr:helix-turn-helix transcriptional regulator [Clostridiales bacterium]
MKSIRFSENLRELRVAKKLTQKQLADILQVDQRTISAWEKGVCEPNFSILLKLCEFFDETFDNILT